MEIDVYGSFEHWREAFDQRRRREVQREQVLRDAAVLRCGHCSQVLPVPPPAELDLREGLKCERCELNARQRAGLAWVEQWLRQRSAKDLPKVYLCEQLSSLQRALRQCNLQLSCSEYLPRGALRRLRLRASSLLRRRQWLRHEDVCALSFPGGRFDLLICNDVLEHVPNYSSALREFARVLRPGGRLLLTVPFSYDRPNTLVRASRDTETGAITHYLPPERHGDPMRDRGVLAYYNFAWDLLDELRSYGFVEPRWVEVWKPEAGVLGSVWLCQAVRKENA